MSIQEKIDRLALAALRSAAPSATRPQPVTFMLPFERPRMVAIVAGSDGCRDARFGAPSPDRGLDLVINSPSPWPFAARELYL